MTIPNILSGTRLGCAPVLLVLAWYNFSNVFLAVLIFAFLLDAIDGPIARKLGQVTTFGPKIDTWADVSIYLSFILGAWWLWPLIMQQNSLYIVLVLLSILLPALTGIIKFGKTTSYHTWLVKLSALCMSVTAILLFMFGPVLPFKIASVLCVIAAAEEIAITLMLDSPASDVKSLWHIYQYRLKQ